MRSGFISVKFLKLESNDGIVENSQNMLSREVDWTLLSFENGTASPTIWLDFGNKVTGFLYVELEDSSSGSLVYEYGPTLDSMFYRKTMPMPANNVLTLDGSFVALRYLKLSLASESPFPYSCFAKIRRIGIRDSSYPALYKGGFESDVPLWNDIWQAGAYTVQLCMQPSEYSYAFDYTLTSEKKAFVRDWRNPYSKYVIWDGPRRDREAWIGDVRTEALLIYSAFGAYEVAKSTLALFYDLQNTAGIVPGSATSGQDFKEYNLWWLASVWECYLFSGDKAFLAYIYPGIRRLLEWIFYSVDDRGFLYNDKGWMWTFPRQGYNGATQCVLYFALECAEKLELTMDNTESAEACRVLREEIKRNINAEFWDEAKGVYFDTIHLANLQTFVPSDINCYATVFGIADTARTERVLDYLKNNMWNEFGSTTIDKKIRNVVFTPEHKKQLAMYFGEVKDEDAESILWTHNKQIWPFIVAYEVEANFIAGRTEDAFALIEACWGNMLGQDPGTFWEFVDAESGEFSTNIIMPGSRHDIMGSACHGWSGWVAYLMQAYVLGIKPSKAGFAEIIISPQLGVLRKVSGSLPTPHGIIKLSIEMDEARLQLSLDCPDEVAVHYEISASMLSGRTLEIVRNKQRIIV
ncbi:hypothetical protein EHS13_27295 [Paenibacillus psychroresistens]|uniref:Alpha-L-rhamnosidase six-hairpin glycosidase domain-containing protein n=1 Tax=Paenibacillus psychroresistens TaxID=1778678 RepID=A0A6B8RSP4_9BACL|nr:amylo-alpha-1,6-glucosidase [Paenibacillus psychroresistens]QGQ98326.1 hypothetical protein EHS13_27295 [Paenibacillus psychroresistens]